MSFGNQIDEYERQEAERRRLFIERMEQKLQYKESAFRQQRSRFSKALTL
jgi:hypothetical protein